MNTAPASTQSQQQSRAPQKPRTDWTHVKDVQRGEVVVRISSTGGFRPRFSISIGRLVAPLSGTEDRHVPHLGVFVEGQGTLNLRAPVALAIGEAVQEAEGWILNECQRSEDQILEDRVKKETKQANAGKPPTKHTGKTEREREKRRNKGKQ
jgi:hypothetical protein